MKQNLREALTKVKNPPYLRKEKNKGSFVKLAPESLKEGEPDLHYILLGDNTCTMMPWLIKLYSRRQLTMEERIANYRISRGRGVVENVIGILASRFVFWNSQDVVPGSGYWLLWLLLITLWRMYGSGTGAPRKCRLLGLRGPFLCPVLYPI